MFYFVFFCTYSIESHCVIVLRCIETYTVHTIETAFTLKLFIAGVYKIQLNLNSYEDT